MERMDNMIDSLQAARSRHPAMQKRIEEGSDPGSSVAGKGNTQQNPRRQLQEVLLLSACVTEDVVCGMWSPGFCRPGLPAPC